MLRWFPDRYGFKGSGHNPLSSLSRDPCHIPELHSRGNTIAVRIRLTNGDAGPCASGLLPLGRPPCGCFLYDSANDFRRPHTNGQ